MIEAQKWMPDVLEQLKGAFGARLCFLGLQGSYRRGEATETSDIDLVVLLDTVALDDLDVYRGIVHSMPEGQKACGFMSGIEEFAHWLRRELFPFAMDTDGYYGKLDDFLPPIGREDVQQGAKIGASALLYFLTHSYLYTDAASKPAILRDSYKSAFFVMQVAHYLAAGLYCRSKQELLACLQGAEKEIIVAGMDFPAWLAAHSEKQAFNLLLNWCRSVMMKN